MKSFFNPSFFLTKMKLNFFLKILLYFGFLPIISLFAIKPLEAKVPVCSKNIMKEGKVFRWVDKDHWTVSVTKKKFYKGSKENYSAILGLARLEAFEEFLFFILDEDEYKKNAGLDLDNFPESLKFGKSAMTNFSWNKIKRNFASMKILEECVNENKQIVFSAIWDSKDIKKLNNQIALDDAFIDLLYYFEDQIDQMDQLEKNYPDVFSIEDPNVLIEIINKHKKLGKF